MSNTILFVGDVCFNGNAFTGVKWGSDLLRLFGRAEAVVYNLEGPIVAESNIDGVHANKTNLKNPANTLNLLPKSKCQVFNLANNHVFDYGNAGLMASINTINEYGGKFMGAGKGWEDAAKPILFEFTKKKVWLFAVTVNYDNIPDDSEYQLSTFQQIKQLIREINKIDKKDIVILNAHIGEEYTLVPSPPKKKLFKYLTSICKIDFLIAHHSHTPQSIEWINGTLVAYSLGNFVFNLNGHNLYPMTNKGLVLSVNFDDDKPQISAYLSKYNKGRGQVELLNFMTLSLFDAKCTSANYYKNWRREAFRVVFESRKLKAENQAPMLKTMHPLKWFTKPSFYQKLQMLMFDSYNWALFRDAYLEKLLRKYNKQ